MSDFRKLLTSDGDTGFPTILLGRLPKELIDIGLILVSDKNLKNTSERLRRAFCLWCLTLARMLRKPPRNWRI